MSLFADKNAPNPFRLRSRELRPSGQIARERHKDARHTASVAFFPWTATNSTGLWDGYTGNPTIKEHWSFLMRNYRGVYAVAVRRTVRILSVASEAKNIVHTVELDQHDEDTSDIPFEQANSIRAIAWAIDPNTVPFRPLLLIAASSVLHVYDVVRQCSAGTVKGHGGEITSITVLPTFPQLAVTTSRDFTTRFYDLTMNARLELPDWKRPPRGSDHYCGPPFGLPPRALDGEKTGELPAEVEGIGIGKCIGVLWGPVVGREELPGGELRRTRVGGHQGSVLSADFHPRRSLIATCGADNAVKVWRHKSPLPWPSFEAPQFFRTQLPIFSSTGVHDSRVRSIRWINDDILLSESIVDHAEQATIGSIPVERRMFVLWQCFVADQADDPNGEPPDMVYQDIAESKSYRVISQCDVPDVPVAAETHLSLTGSTILLLVPTASCLRVFNVTQHFPAPAKVPFPRKLVELRKYQDYPHESAEWQEFAKLQRKFDDERFEARPLQGGWNLNLNSMEDHFQQTAKPHQRWLAACAMSPDRRYIVAASIEGDIYAWGMSSSVV